MAKRTAARELNQDNWNREEEPEEIGVFRKADADVLQSRVIKTAKRRTGKLMEGETNTKPNPFTSFAGFGSASPPPSSSTPFSFLSQNAKSNTDDNSKTIQESNVSKEKESKNSAINPFVNLLKLGDNPISNSAPKDAGNQKASDQFKPFENVFKTSNTTKEADKKSQNLDVLKDLNLCCSKWIAENLEKNPYCILTPIFTDYEKHLATLDLGMEIEKKEKPSFQFSNTGTVENSSDGKQKSFKISASPFVSESAANEKKEEKSEESKPSILPPAPTFNFKPNVLGSASAIPAIPPFGGILSSAPTFNLNSISAKPVDSEVGSKNDEESEEPPKNEFVPVVEEDSIFDMRCKVFVKKDSGYVSKGVGTMFIKPVKDSEKNQLLVRADTSLGNILVNILLTPSLPIQKMGTNNVMIVCLPTPDSEPPPVPILIRVKTKEDCDKAIKKLEECRGS